MMMYRREPGNEANTQSMDLQKIRNYEENGCKLKELLQSCKEQDVKIAFQNKTVEPDWMMAVYQMIMQRTRDELKVEQKAGIERALKRREEGKGTYGRPRVKLPNDFEHQLKERIKKNENLSIYCAQIKMKKSTFYKWVKIYKEAWRTEEANTD